MPKLYQKKGWSFAYAPVVNSYFLFYLYIPLNLAKNIVKFRCEKKVPNSIWRGLFTPLMISKKNLIPKKSNFFIPIYV